ncbi:MAG: hypothetical protein AB9856_20745 [Cellulosilyticaceae bacterium]
MQKVDGYENITVSEGNSKLPAGGYKCIVKQVKIEPWSNGKQGSSLVLAIDIIEGEHKDFFKKQFEGQTQNKKWPCTYRTEAITNTSSDKSKEMFKRLITSIERSNAGYNWDWDEKKLKGKKVGIVFGEVERQKQDGSGTYMWTEPRWARSLDTVLDAEVPAPKMLQGSNTPITSVAGTPVAAWTPNTAAQDDDDDLPF